MSASKARHHNDFAACRPSRRPVGGPPDRCIFQAAQPTLSPSEQPMASVNKVIIVGNLGKDPEVRYLPN
ncbi:MAG: hypothetical protein ABIN96_09595, partial [Rubrivivax sp.]